MRNQSSDWVRRAGIGMAAAGLIGGGGLATLATLGATPAGASIECYPDGAASVNYACIDAYSPNSYTLSYYGFAYESMATRGHTSSRFGGYNTWNGAGDVGSLPRKSISAYVSAWVNAVQTYPFYEAEQIRF
jgi:hypothetical protein